MRRDSAPAGVPCWIDLMTSDVPAARRFYEQLFGWTSEEAPPEFGGYVNFSLDGVRVAGCMAKQDGNPVPDCWSIYLSMPDAAAAVASAAAHGGQVIVPAMEVGDLGSMAVVIDAGGAAIGIWQPGEHQGFGIVAETNAPAWFELWTRDHAATVQFYRDVFGWDTHAVSDTDEFRYTTLGEGDDQAAGIMDATAFLPEGMAHWSVYIAVDDADATAAKAKDLGGSVEVAPEDTPYGRLATITDTTGARIKLVADTAAG